MKRSDIKKCCKCNKGVMHTGLPLFWTIDIQRWGVNANAVQRQHGMEQFFGGNVALADVFGDGAPIASPINDPLKHFICEECVLSSVDMAQLVAVHSDLEES